MPPSPARLAVDAFLSATSDRSAATLRQRRWALLQAVDMRETEVAFPRPEDLLDPSFVTRFLDAAAQGALSGRTRRSPADRSSASTRARLASLRAFAQFVGAPPPDQIAQTVPLRPVLGQVELSFLLHRIGTTPSGTRPSAARARLAAIFARMWLEPVRTFPLLAMTVDDVLVDGTGRPFAVRGAEGDLLALSPAVGASFQVWLAERQSLVDGLSGSSHGHLWVSAHTVPGDGRSWAAGLPLRARGLQRSYARAIAEVNGEQVGTPGFPLPRSLELLRRSILARVTNRSGVVVADSRL